MRLCFVIGSADISGGTFVIFQHALGAQDLGHEVTIVPLFDPSDATPAWHPALASLRFASLEEATRERFDLAIATWWKTVFELPSVLAERYAYFVQSIESRFLPAHEQPLRALVDATYATPMPVITEAAWIRQYLSDRYGTKAWLVPNGVRKDVYRPDGPAVAPREPGRLRVLVEGPLEVPFKNVPRTIRLCRRSEADEIWLLTISPVTSLPGVDRVFSRVPITRTAEVYRSCDVLVKLSYVEGMFGPPLEMFHCGGTAVSYDVTGHDEYMVHGTNALVARTDDEAAVVGYLNALKRQPELLARLTSSASATAVTWPGWESSSARFLEAVGEILEAPPVDRSAIAAPLRRAFATYESDERERLAGAPLEHWRRRGVAWLRARSPETVRRLSAFRARRLAGRSRTPWP